MKKFFLSFALIPFLASILCAVLFFFALYFFDPHFINYLAPVFAAGIYFIFRDRIDMAFAAKVNGIVLLLLLLVFTGKMLLVSGNVEGSWTGDYLWTILPFFPLALVWFLRANISLYLTAFLTYAACFALCAFFGKIRIKKILLPLLLAVICVITNIHLYNNRPAVRYGGHGFAYMQGYSSTDFSDYMVYSQNSKLAVPDTPAALTIENEKDMPVLDGAEACYPLYAAFAKAVYKDIDIIEQNYLREAEKSNGYLNGNGKIVSFTNSVVAFERLLNGGGDAEKIPNKTDMFFGARPSVSQEEHAAKLGIPLKITPIGKEAFIFFVEADNPVDNLTTDQLKAIYHGDILNWQELGGEKQEIVAFQRPENSGSQTMMQYFMGDLSLKEPLSYEMVGAMGGVIKKVAEFAHDKGAIAYSFRYFLEELNQETGVKMLSVNGVYPSLENIEKGTYPLVTNVCLITREEDPNPYVQEMIDFILSEQGQSIIRKTGYAGIGEAP